MRCFHVLSNTYWILEPRLKPYARIAPNVIMLRKEEIPCSWPNCLFKAAISWECGGASQLLLPSFVSVFWSLG